MVIHDLLMNEPLSEDSLGDSPFKLRQFHYRTIFVSKL